MLRIERPLCVHLDLGLETCLLDPPYMKNIAILHSNSVWAS